MLVAVVQADILHGLLASGKTEMKASPHRQKGKALCDVQTFAVREGTRMQQGKHFHYVSKAEQMQSGQTLGLEERWHFFSLWRLDRVKMDQKT